VSSSNTPVKIGLTFSLDSYSSPSGDAAALSSLIDDADALVEASLVDRCDVTLCFEPMHANGWKVYRTSAYPYE